VHYSFIQNVSLFLQLHAFLILCINGQRTGGPVSVLGRCSTAQALLTTGFNSRMYVCALLGSAFRCVSPPSDCYRMSKSRFTAAVSQNLKISVFAQNEFIEHPLSCINTCEETRLEPEAAVGFSFIENLRQSCLLDELISVPIMKPVPCFDPRKLN